jgi:hypothetical protein
LPRCAGFYGSAQERMAVKRGTGERQQMAFSGFPQFRDDDGRPNG